MLHIKGAGQFKSIGYLLFLKQMISVFSSEATYVNQEVIVKEPAADNEGDGGQTVWGLFYILQNSDMLD